MLTLRLARHAMNTRFEVLLHGDSEAPLRAAGEEALEEIARLEDQLSLFRPASEIARVNRDAAAGPVRVSPPVFDLLQRASVLSAATQGAFDPTIGPLMRAWGFLGAGGALPAPAQLAAARECVGMDKVLLDAAHFTVRFTRPGLLLDLGAVGKGYAIDCAVERLRDAGVSSAFIHGGTSSCAGLGLGPDGVPWKTAIAGAHQTARECPLAEVALRDEALGVSEVRTKSFAAAGRLHGHVLDPRSGEPARQALVAAVALPSAAEADALSTALLTLGEAGLACLAAFRPDARLLVLTAAADGSPGRLLGRNLALMPGELPPSAARPALPPSGP